MEKNILAAILIWLLILAGGVALTQEISGDSTADPHPAFDIPIYPGGYDIIKKSNPAGRSQTVNYSVQIKLPAAEILEFYDSYFNAARWIPSFEICQRHWDNSTDGGSKDAIPLKQMYASWEHPEHDLKVVLWLKLDPTIKQMQEVVKVECRLQRK